MVSLIDIYNIKESTFNEIKSDRNPARGNKAKGREKDFYFIVPLVKNHFNLYLVRVEL